MIGLLVKFVVTVISLLIISKLPVVGVDIDSPGKAAISAIVIGILNVLMWPLIKLFSSLPLHLDFLPVFILNVIIFGLAAALVPGFRLQNKLLSAIFGAALLTLFNVLIQRFLPFGDAETVSSSLMLLSNSIS
ncbi:MAG: phage holin family protein [Cyanobacteria bacterium P01_A01_bin.17]